MGFQSLISLLVAIFYYWPYMADFKVDLFFIGFFASLFDSVGKSIMAFNLTIGPAGPILCFKSLESVILTVFEALRLNERPN